VSKVWNRQVNPPILVGYSGNCGCHNNRWDKLSDCCRKSVTITPLVDGSTARLLVKLWLIKGIELDRTDCDSRDKHGNVKPHTLDPFEFGSETEVDAYAAMLLEQHGSWLDDNGTSASAGPSGAGATSSGSAGTSAGAAASGSTGSPAASSAAAPAAAPAAPGAAASGIADHGAGARTGLRVS